MIDPSDVTRYNQIQVELEEYLCFCLCVAGHKATTTAKHLDACLRFMHDQEPKTKGWRPFQAIRKFTCDEIRQHLKSHGIGGHKVRSKGLYYLCNSNLDLKTCSREDLLLCPGVGMKTASYFILHTRPDVRIACFDRHICRWMDMEIPKNKKEYLLKEKDFLARADDMKMTPAELDLLIWNMAQENDYVSN